MENGVAYLGNIGEYTTFSYGDITITFLTGKSLEKYTSVVEWDAGYLVVMAQNFGKEPHEDYIDLLPILDNLYMKTEAFLEPIKEVKLNYE